MGLQQVSHDLPTEHGTHIINDNANKGPNSQGYGLSSGHVQL